jgi:hypothetical protein
VSSPWIGSSFDDFLASEGLLEDAVTFAKVHLGEILSESDDAFPEAPTTAEADEPSGAPNSHPMLGSAKKMKSRSPGE